MLKSMTEGMGNRIREQREILGYTREKFAEKLDISVTFAADIELGNKGMSLDTLIKICELLSVSADHIIFGREMRSDNPIAEMTAFLDDSEMEHAKEIMKAYINAVSDAKLKNID